MCQMINHSMEEVYKYEAETLRKMVYQCAELLYKYGHKFDKEDRDKAIDIVCSVEAKKAIDDLFKTENEE